MTKQMPPPGLAPGSTASSRQQLPHFELQEINQQGAVFRSHCAYEPGTSFVFGIHLPGARRHRLMDLEAIVVDCHATGGGAELGWEVTFIFECITAAQVSVLRAAARSNRHPEPFLADDAVFGGTRSLCAPGLN